MIITDRTRIENIINRTPIWERTNDIDADQQIGTTPLDLVTIKNKYIGDSVIDEMHTYGMPESNETLFLRLGLDHLMDLIKDAAPTD